MPALNSPKQNTHAPTKAESAHCTTSARSSKYVQSQKLSSLTSQKIQDISTWTDTGLCKGPLALSLCPPMRRPSMFLHNSLMARTNLCYNLAKAKKASDGKKNETQIWPGNLRVVFRCRFWLCVFLPFSSRLLEGTFEGRVLGTSPLCFHHSSKLFCTSYGQLICNPKR